MPPVGVVITTSAGVKVVGSIGSSKCTAKVESGPAVVPPSLDRTRAPAVSIVTSTLSVTVAPVVGVNVAVTRRGPSGNAGEVKTRVPA